MTALVFVLGALFGAGVSYLLPRAPLGVRVLALVPVAIYVYSVVRGLQGPDASFWLAGLLGVTGGSVVAMLWRSRRTSTA